MSFETFNTTGTTPNEVQLLLDTITRAASLLNTNITGTDNHHSQFETLQAARIISAAALQLEAIVAPPEIVLYHVVGGFFKSMALRVCLESNVTEILRDAGQQGMHIQDIAKANGQDPQKLARFLRYLCSNHVYKEVSPDVFANNRISSLIDTGKSIEELREKPFDKYKNTDGMAALVGHHLDECFKGAAYSWETLTDPTKVPAEEHIRTPLNKAYNLRTPVPYFQFLQRADQTSRRLRFDASMQGMERMQPPDVTLNAFEWGKLAKGSKIVDIGGGIGNVFFPVAERYPELNIVIQDLPGVVENAKNVWADRMPDALHTGRVKPEAHNFFDAQPHKDASVFFIKHVLHNWSDSSCVKILRRLRDACASDDSTRLVIMDSAMPYVCRAPQAQRSDSQKSIHTPGFIEDEAPEPLLANYGALTEMAYVLDMVMFVILDAQERTYSHLCSLLNESGWVVVSVKRKPGDAAFVQIEAKPDYSRMNTGSIQGKL